MLIKVHNKELIAVCGKMGSGKTTLANNVAKNLDFEVVSLATPFKEYAEQMLERKIDKSKDRRLLVDLGQFLKGKKNTTLTADELVKLNKLIPDLYDNPIYFKDDIWIKLLLQRLKTNKRYIIDDLRFLVEYGILVENLAVIVLVECLQGVIEKRLVERDGSYDKSIFDTPSEREHTMFSHYDIITVSTGTEEQTYDTFLKRLINL